MNDSAQNLELEEQFFLTNGAKWQRMFPWLRMFRAFRIAIGVKCLLLGVAGVMLLPLGEVIIRQLSDDTQVDYYAALEQQMNAPKQLYEHAQIPFKQLLAKNFQPQPDSANVTATSESGDITAPHWYIFSRTIRVAKQSSPLSWSLAVFVLVWGLSVFAIFGGAIARVTAHEITGTGSASLFGSLQFSLRRTHSYLSAPLLTLVGMGMCWLPLIFAGLIGRIPFVGEFLVAILWVVLLMLGLFLALILIGVMLGWPLMFTTISVEASDAFDGLSRAFSYIFNRPWYALFLVVLMSVYGSILSHFVVYLQQFAIRLTDQAVTTGLGGKGLAEMPSQLINQWMWIVQRIPLAFGFSFFWVSITIVYFLLRHAEDGTPFFVLGKDKFATSDLPLSGIPAAELREMKLHKESETTEDATDA